MRVKYIRDGLTEEFHTGSFVQYSKMNKFTDETPYYLRSCAKPLQAALLIDYGADKVFKLSLKEIVFICGSHAGEECHIKLARQILKKIGLNESYLKCGVHEPLSGTMRDKMLISRQRAGEIHNNCSGKHIGFLALCKLKQWDLETYYEPEHPLQIAVKEKINKLCEVNTAYPVSTDGCGVPIFSMPLKNMLAGYINLFCSRQYEKITRAFLENPYILGGENRLDTEVIQKTENLTAKVGAGGLCIVVNTVLKDGFLIKIDDASEPARRIAVLEMINRLGWGNINYDNKIRTLNGKYAGIITVDD